MRGRARIKKWGGSLAIVIASDVVKAKDLRPGGEVEYEVEPVGLRMCDIAGLLHGEITDEDLEAMEKELEHGWED